MYTFYLAVIWEKTFAFNVYVFIMLYNHRIQSNISFYCVNILHAQYNIIFYCATIAYHVGLNALLVAARHRRPTLEKNKHVVGSAS